MDSMMESEITGDVLIPLENGNFYPDKNPPSYQDFYSCSYKSFRNVLFQGETLKFYIILKANKPKEVNISYFFDKLSDKRIRKLLILIKFFLKWNLSLMILIKI